MTDRRARHDEVRRVLDAGRPGDVSAKRIRALSGGMRRRVALAQALLGDPDLLVLDEPTAGLDPEQRLRFRELISRVGEGRTVVLSTHQTEDVTALCPQVVVIDHGRIRSTAPPASWPRRPRGRVWTAPSGRRRAARVAHGGRHLRNVGDPARAPTLPPTLEDAYLLLVGDRGAGGCGMTDLLVSGPGRQAAAVPPPTVGGPWAVVPDLALRHAIRMVRHPVLLLGVLWYVLVAGPHLPKTPYDQYSIVTGMVAFVLGPLAFFAANLVASAGRRSGADEWTPSLPLPAQHRTCALLLPALRRRRWQLCSTSWW